MRSAMMARRAGLMVAWLLALAGGAAAQDCRQFRVGGGSLSVSAEARARAPLIDILDPGQVVCVTRETKDAGEDWAYVSHVVKAGAERQPIDGWVPLRSLTAVASPEPRSAEAASMAGTQEALRFSDPIPFGPYPVSGQSIEALAKGQPLFPPFEGLEEATWKQPCSSCHAWDRKALCEQGGRYAADPRTTLRIRHPYGGPYKVALMRWFKSGCR